MIWTTGPSDGIHPRTLEKRRGPERRAGRRCTSTPRRGPRAEPRREAPGTPGSGGGEEAGRAARKGGVPGVGGAQEAGHGMLSLPWLAAGAACGVFVAQNYRVPDVTGPAKAAVRAGAPGGRSRAG